MGTRVIRASRRSPVRPDAGSTQPRLNIAASPYPTPGVLGIALGRSVLAFGILRPIYCEAIANQPIAEIGFGHRTPRHDASVLVQRDRVATHWPIRDEGVEIVRGFRAAAIMLAVVAPAELGILGRVDETSEVTRAPV